MLLPPRPPVCNAFEGAPTSNRSSTTGEVAPSPKCLRTHSGPTGIYILLYEISSDTHVWSYVFMCGTSGQYFWTYILKIHSGAECLYACCCSFYHFIVRGMCPKCFNEEHHLAEEHGCSFNEDEELTINLKGIREEPRCTCRTSS